MKHRIAALLLAGLLAVLCVVPAGAAKETAMPEEPTILFTHDLHSHFLPLPDGEGGEYGGYARLKTAIDRERAKYPNALVVDGGDFSIGSLIQSLYTAQAAELRTMGAMGYDATTIGNHEFDHESRGFGEMLNTAKEAQTASIRVLASSTYPNPLIEGYAEKYGPLTFMLPAVVSANYRVSEQTPDGEFVQQAMDDYGVCDTLVIERGGIKYGIFGIMGQDAHECAPTSGFSLQDDVEAAKRCVASLQEQGADVIVCLSHAGNGETLAESEDEILAEEVDGINVIVSAHTHTSLYEPIIVDDTYIVSAAAYSRYLGRITLQQREDGKLRLKEYQLIPIDETIPEDPEIAAMVEQWKNMVGGEYLEPYGLTYDQVLTTADFELRDPDYSSQSGNNLGELIADSFLWAVEHLEADAPNVTTVSVTAAGVIRAALAKGDLTASQAFDVLSMGVGSDGTSGFPLVAVYLTGEELKAAAEVDASVTPIMPAAQLYMGGIKYKFNTHRMFFNRVVSARFAEPPFVNDFTGSGLAEIEDDQLYRVVTGMYSAQMLGTVKSKSMGLLSLEPKMADGSPVTDFNACILRDEDGNEIKEWYALAAYLEQFGEEGVPEWYAQAEGDGRKYVSDSWNPVEHLTNIKGITLIAEVVIAVLLVLAVAVLMAIRRFGKKRRQQKKQK